MAECRNHATNQIIVPIPYVYLVITEMIGFAGRKC